MLLNWMRVRAGTHIQLNWTSASTHRLSVFDEPCTDGIVCPHLRVFQPIHHIEWESGQAVRQTKRTRKETKVTKRQSFCALPRADKRIAILTHSTAISSEQAQQAIAILFTVFISADGSSGFCACAGPLELLLLWGL